MRKRPVNTDYDDQDDAKADTPFIFKMPSSSNSIPCAQDLIAMKPQKHGYCYKENRSIWASLCCCCTEKWKKRYFVLIGNYLIRFKSEYGEQPKGVPIPIDSATVSLREPGCFEVSTIRKTYQLRVDSQAEAIEWVKQINTRKVAAIKENMGHATMSKEVSNVNRAAHKLFDERLREDRNFTVSEVNSAKNPIIGM